MLSIIYKIYERFLTREVKKFKLPNHIAFIMDGNRRFARKLGLPSKYGHVFGSDKVEDVLDWCWALRIKNITIYAFSTENFKRSEEEKRNIFNLVKIKLIKLINDERVHKDKIRIKIVGKKDLLPKDLRNIIKMVEERTKNYKNFNLNIALAYGGRQELTDAIVSILKMVKKGKIKWSEISQDLIETWLYCDGGYKSVDLLIRTGGEQRLSNFLPWQSANSVAYFCDVYWPEFRKIDLLRAIRAWQQRVKLRKL